MFLSLTYKSDYTVSMNAASSPETSVILFQTTQLLIPRRQAILDDCRTLQCVLYSVNKPLISRVTD